MTTPAAAQPDRAPAGGERAAATHHLTLITGDRVQVDAKGRIVGFEPAKGRERIPVQKQTRGGHTLVVPADARRLISTGRLDQRLFDVTELSRPENRRAQHQGLRLIVGYRGAQAAAAKAEVRDAGGTTVGRTLKSLNAQSLTTPKADAPDIWQALTDTSGGGRRTTAAGIDRVWLDGVRRASLDKSVAQIGAPTAWEAGFTGKGVKIAVLDTGVDATHADLKDQVVAQKNFSDAADALDRFGHGTHVASIAAGTGAASNGTFKGVAPDAELLNGKVLDDNGYGNDSGILAGMEWAAAEGADIVNLSLGGGDTPEIDPLEAAVNKLSAEKGILFAVAAGNEGEGGASTVGSPGSADAALTVGAVDDKDVLAPFSSRGPRIGDGAIKPDVTAPGVDITAAAAPGSVIDREVGQKPPGYLTISGTSMATPHVAGAAALLKQQHPAWKYTELKGALTSSSKPGAYTPFEQGSGRIAVDKALGQTIVADPVSVSFGMQQWPHTDDTPVTKKVTYRNLGTTDVTLDLAVTGTGPKGKPAPAGFFTLGTSQVTVPAGGTADVALTADTRLGSTVDGTYSAYLVGTGGGQTVRTAAAVEREIESYDVKVTYIGRDGKPARYADSDLVGISAATAGIWASPGNTGGSASLRVPKGTYALNANLYVDPEDSAKGIDWLVQPKLEVNGKKAVTLDARTAKSVNITLPEKSVTPLLVAPEYTISSASDSFTFGWFLDTYKGFRTAHLGPKITDGSLAQHWVGSWSKGSSAEYDIALGGPAQRFATGYARKLTAGQFAKVKIAMGAPARKKTGEVTAWGTLPSMTGGTATSTTQKLPSTRTVYVSTVDKARWNFDFSQLGGADEDGRPMYESNYSLGDPRAYAGGKTYTKTVNRAVFGPLLDDSYGLSRTENEITGKVPLLADGNGNAGSSELTSVKTVLYRNGKKFAQNKDALYGETPFVVPSGAAEYTLKTSVRRSDRIGAASTRIDAGWTFRSKRTSDAELPASMVRFTPTVGADSKVVAGRAASVPVQVQGSAAGRNLKSLKVYVSYNAGKTWKKVAVKKGAISVKNPAKGKSISFAAKVTDKKGNLSTVAVYNAYYGK
ncbi:S8 family serine peptidase [Streptomyces finlayi]|uniref:S8 family serine peptidase n=1 Tax=Streptomyces finlayi TaxID=67296 RepID=A0A7G7BV44_9ACTN|nr:S8 family serine peptidase [Streptomyces finlayi]QNE79209.1 S8 family serine peptidase [Streptomyces finlayi]